MNQTYNQDARLLVIAGALLVGQTVALLFAESPTLLRATGVFVALLLAFFMIRPSRIAWTLVVFVLAGEIAAVATGERPIWVLIISLSIVVLLAMPASLRFVWLRKPGLDSA